MAVRNYRTLLVAFLMGFSSPFKNHGAVASHTNFEVRRFEVCNNTQGLIKYLGNITKEGDGNQYLHFNMTTPIPWNENVGVSCSIQSRIVNTYMELFVIREKNVCKAAEIYMGEFWNDIKRGARFPASCPIPAGRYLARHVKLDFHKITLQTFPFGRLRFILKLVDNKNIHLNLLCWLIEVDNVED